MGEMRNCSEVEMDHLNGWNLGKMPTRYAGCRDSSAKLTRHLHLQLIMEARIAVQPQPLDWAHMRMYLSTCQVHEVKAQVLVGLTSEQNIAETPSHLLEGLVLPIRQFRTQFAKASHLTGARKLRTCTAQLPLPLKDDQQTEEALEDGKSEDDKARRQKEAQPLKSYPLVVGNTAADLALSLSRGRMPAIGVW